jgi:hypothetical protein
MIAVPDGREENTSRASIVGAMPPFHTLDTFLEVHLVFV